MGLRAGLRVELVVTVIFTQVELVVVRCSAVSGERCKQRREAKPERVGLEDLMSFDGPTTVG